MGNASSAPTPLGSPALSHIDTLITNYFNDEKYRAEFNTIYAFKEHIRTLKDSNLFLADILKPKITDPSIKLFKKWILSNRYERFNSDAYYMAKLVCNLFNPITGQFDRFITPKILSEILYYTYNGQHYYNPCIYQLFMTKYPNSENILIHLFTTIDPNIYIYLTNPPIVMAHKCGYYKLMHVLLQRGARIFTTPDYAGYLLHDDGNYEKSLEVILDFYKDDKDTIAQIQDYLSKKVYAVV